MPIDQRRLISAAKRIARVAGAVYLLITLLVGAARSGVRTGIPIPGYAPQIDPATTQVSIVTAIAVATLFAFTGITLYLLLRHLHRQATRPWMVYVAMAAGMIVVNLLFHHAVMLVATGPPASGSGLDSGGLVALLLDMHDHGYTFAALVFLLGLLALGHLAYVSTRYHGILRVLLIVRMIVATVTRFLWPDLPTVVHTILTPPAVADLWLVAYLVTKGGMRVPSNNVVATAQCANLREQPISEVTPFFRTPREPAVAGGARRPGHVGRSERSADDDWGNSGRVRTVRPGDAPTPDRAPACLGVGHGGVCRRPRRW